MRGPSPLYIEERHRALGRDATFSWSRALTHPPRCNRTRHRGRHLVSDFVGPPSWCRGGRHLGPEVVGAAIFDRKWRQMRYSGAYTTAQVENARSALEPTCMLLSLFVLHQKPFKGGSWNFWRDAGEGNQAFVERVLEGTPSPKSHAPFPRGMWLKLCIKRIMFAYTWRNQWSLDF